MQETKLAVILLIAGLALFLVNELMRTVRSRVVYKYIPRDLDTYFKDPKNQPFYVYKSMWENENVRTF